MKIGFAIGTLNYSGAEKIARYLLESFRDKGYEVGLPCIATDCSGGGAAALIKNGENGLLVPSNDEDAMFDAMTKMANDQELRKRLANEAYKINETLEFNKIISMWINYIESVAKGGKK